MKIKKILAFALICASFSIACPSVPALLCNSDIPTDATCFANKNACWISTSFISPIITTHESENGKFVEYSMDMDESIKILTAKGFKKIRLTIYSNNPGYNEIQALAQTGYVTRSILMFIFPNPVTIPNSCQEIGSDIISCPITSIGLNH
ncbi:MAG: hypothetical protein MJY99_07345 [Fibrobacter sp.]|uniref:hypothetical protein n=1 Tax=Fibrobacter sp. TaxID=35828 RepID=UPI00388FFC35|nr:hypothetical protein [Fibrobacter sp.]